MIRSFVSMSLVVMFSVSLMGCTDRAYNSPEEQAQNACRALGPKTLSGALIGGLGGAGSGAGIGGLAGGGKGALIGALAGAGLGVLSGTLIGHHLDHQDCLEAQMALGQLQGKKVGQSTVWQNASTGSHGSYTALTPEKRDANTGKICRRVRQVSTIKDHQSTSEIELTCRDANGNYSTVEPVQN